MKNRLFGEQHHELVKWLTGSWLQAGPPIAVIQGFPGLGKTAIAEQVIAGMSGHAERMTVVHFDCPDESPTLVDDLALILGEELNLKGDGGFAKDLNDGLSVEKVFRKLLLSPRLIVLDEAQRLMGELSNTPKNMQIGRILENLSWSTGSPGRVLLLSNREFGQARWNERAEIYTVRPLRAKEAQDYLRALLNEDNRADAVPEDRIADVVSWLGGNPRAIHLLAAALRRETLEFLIGLAPDAWEARDREVSPHLLKAFEERVLARAVSQLDTPTKLFLRRLAVFRQPLLRKAFEAMATDEIDLEASRDDLISRYLVELRQGLYHVHPILRETLLHQLGPSQKRNTHKIAGDYFAKAIRAQTLVGKAQALGARFVEARYHFMQSGAKEDLRDIVGRFGLHMEKQFNFMTPVPNDPQELEERVSLLSAVLEDLGSDAMEYHLARCLLARGRDQDRRLAITHIRQSTGPKSPAAAWLLRIREEAFFFGADEAVRAAYEGIKVVPPNQDLVSLYQAAAEILAQDGKSGEAVTLLREGIKVAPPTQGLVSLYQAAAEILAQDGKSGEAVTLLREGIKVVPPTQGLVSLYQAAAEILAEDGKSGEAVTLLREGIKVVPPTLNLVSLYHAAAEILAEDGKSGEAVTLLREGIKVVPPTQGLFSLYQGAAKILAQDGKSGEAITLLQHGHGRIGDAFNGHKLAENATLLACDIGRFDLIDAFELSPRQKALVDVLSWISQDEFTEAAKRAKAWVEKLVPYFTLLCQGFFAIAACGQSAEALEFIAKWSSEVEIDEGVPVAWVFALVELRSGNVESAKGYLDAYSGRSHADDEVSIETLLDYWRASCHELGSALSYYFPRIPPSISGLGHTLVRHQEISGSMGNNNAVTMHKEDASAVRAQPSPKAEKRVVSVLAVATEWSSGRGGLSTFNRQLCVALSQAGAKVACVVLEATTQEVAAAEGMGVLLVEPPRRIGLSDEQRLMDKPMGLNDFAPDLLIGHSMITGPAAASLQASYYPSAHRVHFVHMAPDEIEPYKLGRKDQAGIRAQERTEIEEDLGRSAARVVAVGPRLHGRFATYLAGYVGTKPPLRFDPGFDVVNNDNRDPPEGDPWQVLLLGRAEDVYLKGLDTAASAVAKAARERARGLPRLELVIRGANPDEMDHLRSVLLKEAGPDCLNIVVRAFTVSDERLAADLRRASLVLMPSKAEGFGLVGVEAITAGTPVLVSAESGLGQLLREQLPAEQASRFVVGMDGDNQQLRDRWAGAIDRMLADREASFRRAAELRDVLAAKKTWREEAQCLLDALFD